MTQNLINDVRWKFQKLNITRANIDCFVLPSFLFSRTTETQKEGRTERVTV